MALFMHDDLKRSGVMGIQNSDEFLNPPVITFKFLNIKTLIVNDQRSK